MLDQDSFVFELITLGGQVEFVVSMKLNQFIIWITDVCQSF